ncbi:MFS transporter [Arthrobacter mobilis]|uniref:MHS family MFS transporter n=1 Tax=Arthrobacter mobilis TaxID=2724944 RepID=A0A7X6H9Q3_9MICC|nr:MFS transporter [Arthrobacter mobilis]NKX53053.1 MHS family MFS transporter [Arthrobacter mobilis]
MAQALNQAGVRNRQQPPQSRIKRVVAASMAGTVAEWYEFFIYGTASTLVFGALFFPKTGNPLDGIIAAFATYAVGFVARPLGGLVFGHFGDRYGRKKLLQFSLLLVGAATFLMGCLPGFQTIGYWAPVLLVLLRFLQGFAVGGEWGGAVLLVSEHSPEHQRGFWASFPQAAAPVGNVLATVVMLGLSWILEESAFMSWGWRVAFWLSALIIFIGYMIRRTVEDAPVYLEAMRRQREAQQEAATLREVLGTYPGRITKALIMRIGENSSYYLMIVFSISYLTVQVKADYSMILLVLFLANVVQIFAMLGGGWLSDKIGRKGAIGIGYAGLFVWAVTFFPALNTGNFWAIFASTAFGLTVQAAAYAPQAALMSEIFPTRMRYSGSSFTYQIATIFAGSIAPMIATMLMNKFDSTLPIVVYVLAVLAISAIALSMLKETRGLDLSTLDGEREPIR